MQWVIGLDVDTERRRAYRPYGIATSKGKIYANDGRARGGYWVLDLVNKDLFLVRHSLLVGGTGIAVDDRDYKYLAVPRLAEAKARGTFGTKEEQGTIVAFNEHNEMVKATTFTGRPIDIAVWNDKLFVTDGLNSRVVVLDKYSLEVVSTFGKTGTGDNEFQFPKGISVGEDGRIYVGDTFNGRIKVFGQDGELISQYGQAARVLGGFASLSSVDVDREGRVYAVDTRYVQKLVQDEVQIFDSSKFYLKGEEVKPLTTKREERRNALYGYFKRPYGRGDPNALNAVMSSSYAPVGITIDYDNMDYFKHLAPPGYKFEYLIWLSSQYAYNGKNISVFAFAVKK